MTSLVCCSLTWLEYLLCIYYYFVGSRLWWFQVCSEVAYFQVAPKNDSVRSAKLDTRYFPILLSHGVYSSCMCYVLFKKFLHSYSKKELCLQYFEHYSSHLNMWNWSRVGILLQTVVYAQQRISWILFAALCCVRFKIEVHYVHFLCLFCFVYPQV